MLRARGVCVMAKFAALAACAAASAQQQPPTVTRPSASSVQATPRSASSRYGNDAPAQTNMKVAAGTITGFVYWDMSSAHYKLSSPCQGLTVNVSTIGKPQAGGGQVLATTSNFTPMGPMTDLSARGAPKYMLCSYSFHRMPVGEYLRVTAAVGATAFSTAVSVQNPPDFEILGGNCSNTPQGTLSFILTDGEMVCGNNAYNINLKLYSSGSLSRGTLPLPSGPLLQNASGTSTSSGGTLKLSSGTGGGTTSAGGTLSLSSGTGGATTSSGGTLLQSPGGNRARNPQPLPPRTAANSSAGSPGANVAQATAAVSDYRQPPGNRESPGPNGAVPSGRVLVPAGSRHAGTQHPAASVSAKAMAPVGTLKVQPAGSAPLGPSQPLSAQDRSTSPNSNSIAPALTNVRPAIAAAARYPGTIEGLVFWDASWAPPACDAINITVSVSDTPNVFRSLGTLGNISQYLGTVKYQEAGSVGNVAVCKYTYTNVPVGEDLQVQLSLGDQLLFNIYPFHSTVGPIKIPESGSVSCRMSSSKISLAKPSLSQTDLDSHWGICGNSAYNVNFANAAYTWPI